MNSVLTSKSTTGEYTYDTSFIERVNLFVRHVLAYLNRRALCHARSQEQIEDPLYLLKWYYSLGRYTELFDSAKNGAHAGHARGARDQEADVQRPGLLLPCPQFEMGGSSEARADETLPNCCVATQLEASTGYFTHES